MRLGLAVARPEIVGALDKIRDHYHLDRLALVARDCGPGRPGPPAGNGGQDPRYPHGVRRAV